MAFLPNKRGHATRQRNIPIPGVLLSRDECESKDSSGQSIRWLKDYPDHYIRKHNVVPTERFFTFIEGMYRKIKTNKVSKR